MIKWNEILHFTFNFHIVIRRKGNFCKNIWEIHHFSLRVLLILWYSNISLLKFLIFFHVDFLFFQLLIGLTQANSHLPLASTMIAANHTMTFNNFMILKAFTGLQFYFAGDMHCILIKMWVLKIFYKINDNLNNNRRIYFDKMGRNEVDTLAD